jgi:hypothetical protein
LLTSIPLCIDLTSFIAMVRVQCYNSSRPGTSTGYMKGNRRISLNPENWHL